MFAKNTGRGAVYKPNNPIPVDVRSLINQQLRNDQGWNESSGYDQQQPVVTENGNVVPLPTPSVPRAIASPPGFFDVRLYLDSVNKSSSSALTSGQVSFPLVNFNNGTLSAITSVVRAKVGRFYFPLVTNSATVPEFYYFRKVYMYVSSFPQAQAILAANNKFYHFEFNVTVTGVAVELVPENDTVVFESPIRLESAIDVQFYVPLNFRILPIPKDTVTAEVLTASNPARFTLTIDSATALFGSVGALAGSNRVAVYISGLNTNLSAVNDTANSENGYLVDAVIDGSTISISALDFSAITIPPLPTPPPRCTIVIAKNRFAIPMHFSCMKERRTNSIALVQG